MALIRSNKSTSVSKPNGLVGRVSANSQITGGFDTITVAQQATGRSYGAIAVGDKTTLTISGGSAGLVFLKNDGTTDYNATATGAIDVTGVMAISFYFDTQSTLTFTLS